MTTKADNPLALLERARPATYQNAETLLAEHFPAMLLSLRARALQLHFIRVRAQRERERE